MSGFREIAQWTTAWCVVAVLGASVVSRVMAAVAENFVASGECDADDVQEVDRLLRDQITILADKQENIDTFIKDAFDSNESFQGHHTTRTPAATPCAARASNHNAEMRRTYGACAPSIDRAQSDFNRRYNSLIAKINEMIDNARTSQKKTEESAAAEKSTLRTLNTHSI